MPEEALQDMEQSMELDSANPYVYRNLGIYFLDMQQPYKALEYFTQAQKMDTGVPLIDRLIEQTQQMAD